jgi:hypothetical protein
MLTRSIALGCLVGFGSWFGCATEPTGDAGGLPLGEPAEEIAPGETDRPGPQPTPVPPAETVPPLAEEVAGPQGLVAHDGYLYWVARDGSALRRVPTSGGGDVETVAGLESHTLAAPFALVVGDAGAFVSDAAAGSVLRLDLAGGDPEVVISLAEASPLALALDGALLYAGSDGGDVFEIDLAADGAVRHLATVAGEVVALAVGGEQVYAASHEGTLSSAARADGGVTEIGVGMELSAGIVADGGHVYFADNHVGALLRAAPGGTPELVAGDQEGTAGLALYRDALFFTSELDRKVKRVGTGGGIVMMLAFDEWGPDLVAADRANVFWSSPGVRAILQLTAD